MGPKIDPHLKLADGGHKVEVVGPIGPWDRYIEQAWFWVVVAQVQEEKIVVATADPVRAYKPPEASWGATAEVSAAGAELEPGPAHAWAVASFETRGDKYFAYPWEVSTYLLDEGVTNLEDYATGWPGAGFTPDSAPAGPA